MRAEANCEVQCDEPKRTMCIFAKLSHSRDLNVLPRLVHAMRGIAMLSGMEAAACIRDIKAGRRWSSRAVNEYGGTRKIVADALKYRSVSQALGYER